MQGRYITRSIKTSDGEGKESDGEADEADTVDQSNEMKGSIAGEKDKKGYTEVGTIIEDEARETSKHGETAGAKGAKYQAIQ